MEKLQQHLSSGSNSGEAHGELRRLREHGGASVDEIREFVGQMHGRSAQEVLGAVAQSGLASGIVLSTLAVAAVLVVLTVIPYALSPPEKKETAEAKSDAAVSAEDSADEAGSAAQAAGEAAPGADRASATDETTANAEKAVSKMGIGETKGTTAEDTPDQLDSLLDGVE